MTFWDPFKFDIHSMEKGFWPCQILLIVLIDCSVNKIQAFWNKEGVSNDIIYLTFSKLDEKCKAAEDQNIVWKGSISAWYKSTMISILFSYSSRVDRVPV